MLENTRLQFGRNARHRAGASFASSGFAGIGFLLGVAHRQSNLRAQGSANEETQEIRAIGVSSGIGLFGTPFRAFRRERAKARKATAYLTFVPYLDGINRIMYSVNGIMYSNTVFMYSVSKIMFNASVIPIQFR